jgi:hypothetical protein
MKKCPECMKMPFYHDKNIVNMAMCMNDKCVNFQKPYTFDSWNKLQKGDLGIDKYSKIFEKMKKVIDSCESESQIKSAEKYINFSRLISESIFQKAYKLLERRYLIIL